MHKRRSECRGACAFFHLGGGNPTNEPSKPSRVAGFTSAAGWPPQPAGRLQPAARRDRPHARD
jgi:hypothetical protein